ncbi:2-phosphosulfolactate phosphatase [Microbacterium resistens]|uniref:Probable 2-phosphosulfolactate phosphatase n=1 Tax=Microbacterium resistens TaxID=156977 RepID=A0ABU1S987_9MICO|nr:2-phosphosulfolactate phosphatase [Microbacterium resistens]MDR6866166.1 2-phosphosulfolactate phosphatase [Microbacterium resistens]
MRPSSVFDQSLYQVRLEWGVEGLRRLAPADVVVVVDVLRFTTTVTRRAEKGLSTAIANAPSINGAPIAEAAAAAQALVLAGCLRNATATADAIRAEQVRRDRRTSVAVIAGGERTRGGTDLRFSVEDLLGAGAVIDALINQGIDHASPEAVAAAESFRSLRSGLRHLVGASGSARELRADPERYPDAEEEIRAAAELDVSSVVPVLRNGSFTP